MFECLQLTKIHGSQAHNSQHSNSICSVSFVETLLGCIDIGDLEFFSVHVERLFRLTISVRT